MSCSGQGIWLPGNPYGNKTLFFSKARWVTWWLIQKQTLRDIVFEQSLAISAYKKVNYMFRSCDYQGAKCLKWTILRKSELYKCFLTLFLLSLCIKGGRGYLEPIQAVTTSILGIKYQTRRSPQWHPIYPFLFTKLFETIKNMCLKGFLKSYPTPATHTHT